MKLRCIAVDDEPLALQLVAGYIEKTPFLQLEGAFNDPVVALEKVQETETPLLFLDINMPDLNGLQLSRLLPESCKVVFTTAYEEYALESYRIAALDYLLKPFNYSDFLEAANKAREYFELKRSNTINSEFMFVKADYQLHKVNFADILFVENIKDYVRFHLEDGTKLMSLLALRSLEDTLPANFMKVHRSYIVNLNAVVKVERWRIVFGKELVPVAEQYKAHFQKYLSRGSIQ